MNCENQERLIILPVTHYQSLTGKHSVMTAAIGNWPGHENVAAAFGLLSPANLIDC